MKFGFAILMLVTVFSCKDKTTQPSDLINEAANTAAAKQDKKYDSIDQKKVFGSMVFGMTRKQVAKIKDYNYMDSIGAYQYYFHDYYTKNDSLYFLEIESASRSANYFDTETKDQYVTLRYEIVKKYGEPHIDKGHPDFLSMRPKRIQFTNTWNIGDKIIKVGIGENENQYYACCWIYSESMKEKQDSQRAADQETKPNKF